VDDPGLAEWIEREVRFPNAMVDRITPATTDADRRLVAERFGIEDRWPVVCESFVQWVLEDDFGAGRPPYETAGVQLVADVRPYELMKLRLLNAGHQGLAYFAQLCGYALVHDAARDELIAGFLLAYMDEEATPTLAPVPGIDLHAYKRTLIERFANPGVRDTVDRLCVDSAARLSAFVLPAIREQLATGGEIRRGAAIVASWAVWAEGAGVATTPAELLGDLAEDPRFAAAYRGTLASLRERGPRETLAGLLAGGV
jgi:mannitol 2-dehydrogenase